MYHCAVGNMHAMNVIHSTCVCVLFNMANGHFVVVQELCVLRFRPAQINSQMLSYCIFILVYLGHKWSEVKIKKFMKICLGLFSATIYSNLSIILNLFFEKY